MSQGQYPQYPQQQGYPPPQQGYPQQGYQQQGYPQQQFGQRPTDDEGHLKALSICTFCYAGLVGLVGLFFTVYLIIGVVIAGAAVSSGPSGGAPEAAVMGGVFIVLFAILTFFSFVKAGLLVWSGLSLRKRTRPTLSFVVACISCLNIPMGTTLGVFTILVLNRPSVKALYAQRAQQLA